MRTIQLFILPFLFILLSERGRAQDAAVNPYANIIVREAKAMSGYLLKSDYKQFMQYTHPSLIKLAGGEAAFLKLLQKSMEDFSKQGITMQKADIGQPGPIVKSGTELQCIVPQTLELQMPDGRLRATSSLAAISLDGGKRWYFLDTQGKPIENLRKKIPSISPRLVVPAEEPPVLLDEK